ncbi:hypothetical protein C5167_050944 [Papaver somniferum]|uniref:Uncharacterized protein n=1 Tax=Papaver somniferum TaxID=3469 RepID=A0A4Y7KRJ2_PAPSO|nr:hypothetical protein C5167_050944 [Papaver somniferum]
MEFVLPAYFSSFTLNPFDCSGIRKEEQNQSNSKGVEEGQVSIEDGKQSEILLSWVAIEGRLAAVEYLLEMGANPEIPDDSTCSLLHHAALKGADPNGGPDGNFLTIAAEVGIIQIIKLLVEASLVKAVEVAAVKDNCQGVEIPFPVTSSIPSYVDWSTNGIIEHANSEKFENKSFYAYFKIYDHVSDLYRGDLIETREDKTRNGCLAHVTTGVAVEGGIRSAIVVGYGTYEAKRYKKRSIRP